MRVSLLLVPYHLGAERVGVGAGPHQLLQAGAADVLSASGHDVDVRVVELRRPFAGELPAIVDIAVGLAAQVQQALQRDALPLVLGGDCGAALGALAALGSDCTGLVWFDAHGDFNTPEISPSGLLDGMPLAMACGRCFAHELWDELRAPPLPENHVLHIGGRDFDPEEQRTFATSQVALVTALQVGRGSPADALAPALATLAGRTVCRPRRPGRRRGVATVHVHVDLDVLDPRLAPAVGYPAPGGLDPDEVLQATAAVARRFAIQGLSLTGFDPSQPDAEQLTQARALELLPELVALAQRG